MQARAGGDRGEGSHEHPTPVFQEPALELHRSCWEIRSMYPRARERTIAEKSLGSAQSPAATRLSRYRSDHEVHSIRARTKSFAKRTRRACLVLLPPRPAQPRHVCHTTRGAGAPSDQTGGLRLRLEQDSSRMGNIPIISYEGIYFVRAIGRFLCIRLRASPLGSQLFQFRHDFPQRAPSALAALPTVARRDRRTIGIWIRTIWPIPARGRTSASVRS